MKIDNVKINGIKNPVGYAMETPVVSWCVTECLGGYQTSVRIDVSPDEDFSEIIFTKSGSDLPCSGTKLEFKPEPRTRYYLRVTVESDRNTTASGTAFFETGKMTDPFLGRWIATNEKDTFHPVFIKRFTANGSVKRARAYVTAAGVYELYLNGKKVGAEILAPGYSDYSTFLQIYTYRLDLLQGENIVEIYTGKGWCVGRFGPGLSENNFSPCMAAAAELRIEYENGKTDIVCSGEDWFYRGSDIEDSGIYDGEILNRQLWNGRENTEKPARILSAADGGIFGGENLSDRLSPAICVMETLKPSSVIVTPKNETVLDMGQNFAGYIEFKADFKPGTHVELEFGEVLQDGCFYNDNYRSAKSRYVYVSDGRSETVRAHFTYFGFRYVRLTGWKSPNPEDFTGCVVYSEMEKTAKLETGNQKINRLLSNCLWGMKSNFIDMPTDCPQRDERLGWTGDAQIFAPTACYFMDTRAFYTKFLYELRMSQKFLGGGVPNYLPDIGHASGISSVWGDAAVLIPQTLYRQYGDLLILEKNYALMKDWVDYIGSEDKKGNNSYLYDTGFHFGDWLAQDGITPTSMKGGTDDYFIASVYYYHSVCVVADAANLLNKREDCIFYRELKEKIRAAVFREYFTPSGRLAVDTQTAIITALRFDIYIDRDKLTDQLKERLRRDSYRVKGGFVGAPVICSVLASKGFVKRAYDFLFSEEYPSWLYCVNLGATTIWERWNSILPDGKISGTGMNSLNHYAYGSVAEFIFAYSAGLRPAEPGYSKAIIAPKPDIRLGFISFDYKSPNGRYFCGWRIHDDGMLTVDVEIPFGCTAELHFPGRSGKTEVLKSGRYRYVYMPEIDYRRLYDENTPLDVISRDSRAMKILFEKVPAFGNIAAGEDREKCSITLGQLSKMHFIPHDPKALDDAIAKVCGLIYEEQRS